MAERSARRRQGVVVLVCALAGLGLGLLFTALADDVYRATTLLQVNAAPDPRVPAPQSRRLPAQVLAESYATLLSQDSFLAGIAPQVAAGRYDADELASRVDAEQVGDSAVVKVTAEADSRQEAQAIVTDVVSSFLALTEQLARQRTQQQEDELVRRLAEPLAVGNAAVRAALQAEYQRVLAKGQDEATSVNVVAAAYAPPDPVSPDPVQNLAGGLLLGLVVGLGLTLLRRRPVAEPEAEPERTPILAEPVDETPPRVVLDGPPPESTISGTVTLALEAWDEESGVAELELLAADASGEWRRLALFAAARADAAWDTTTVADGVVWLSAVARDRAGHAAATEPLPLLIANSPSLSSPA